MDKESLREKLAPKLIYSPFLRLVLFNFWFQLGFGAFVLVGVFIALFLPKIWTVSPDNFFPVVKISGLDMAQNWSLKRSARASMAKRDFQRASQSWEAAVAQNPTDKEALHGYLNNALNIEKVDKGFYRSTVSQMGWLLRLGQTNSNDVLLTAKVCEKFGWHDVAAYFLGGVQGNLPPEAEALYLKALFLQGRLREFEPRLAKSAAVLNDPEIPLYELALHAGKKGAAGREDAERELEKKAIAGENDFLATRLHLLACGENGNATGYAKSLESLALRNRDTVADHARYWMLLIQSGRKAEATRLAEAFTRGPESAIETVHLADAYHQLGMLDAARELLKKFASSFPQSPEVWVAYAAVLEHLQDWSGMRSIALQIREDLSGRDTLWGYAYYLEGRAEMEEKRLSSADRAFEKAAECIYEIPPLGFAVARELTKVNPKLALQLYGSIEKSFPNDLPFWEGYFDAAFALHDAATVLKASEHCFRLNPKDLQVHNRYAAALLVNRADPERAVQLTFKLISSFPNSLAARINHCFALLLNKRTSEALAVLDQINVDTLNPAQASDYYLARFEAYHNLERWDDAARAGEKVSVRTLFPPQRDWFKARRAELPSKKIAGAH